MTPQGALDAIQSRLEVYEASVSRLPDYMSPEMMAAVNTLGTFIRQTAEHSDGLAKPIDLAKLRSMLENGVDYTFLSGRVIESRWEEERGYGGDRLNGWGQLADAINWECRSCRPEVGWSKWDYAYRSPGVATTISVQCGHCGDQCYYDDAGVSMDDVE